jgi:hypothetical protein
MASPSLRRLEVDPGLISMDGTIGPVSDRRPVNDVPHGLGCTSQLVAANKTGSGSGLGEATVWNSPGWPTEPCFFVSPPAGLATDGASPPASPRSPQCSPAPVTPELNSRP